MLYLIGWGRDVRIFVMQRPYKGVGGVGRGKVGKIYTNRLIIVKNRLFILVTIDCLSIDEV